MWKEALIGQLITTPVAAALLYPLALKIGMPAPFSPQTFPFLEVAKWMAFAHLFNDVGFYWSHRAFHWKPIYKRFHKQHHTFTGTTSPDTEFSHPLENVLSNIIPTVGGILFTGRPCLVLWVWMFLRLQQTYPRPCRNLLFSEILVRRRRPREISTRRRRDPPPLEDLRGMTRQHRRYETHSGYSFEGTWVETLGLTHASEACEHDHHHSINRGCFGAVWLDWLCGTMDAYVACGGAEGYRKNGGRLKDA